MECLHPILLAAVLVVVCLDVWLAADCARSGSRSWFGPWVACCWLVCLAGLAVGRSVVGWSSGGLVGRLRCVAWLVGRSLAGRRSVCGAAGGAGGGPGVLQSQRLGTAPALSEAPGRKGIREGSLRVRGIVRSVGGSVGWLVVVARSVGAVVLALVAVGSLVAGCLVAWFPGLVGGGRWGVVLVSAPSSSSAGPGAGAWPLSWGCVLGLGCRRGGVCSCVRVGLGRPGGGVGAALAVVVRSRACVHVRVLDCPACVLPCALA